MRKEEWWEILITPLTGSTVTNEIFEKKRFCELMSLKDKISAVD